MKKEIGDIPVIAGAELDPILEELLEDEHLTYFFALELQRRGVQYHRPLNEIHPEDLVKIVRYICLELQAQEMRSTLH